VKPRTTWGAAARAAVERLCASGRLYATTTETAQIFGCDRRTVISAIEAHQIAAVRVGTTYRIPMAWIMSQPGIPGGSGGGERHAA
jgi:excisionase family DNA binding protein